MQFNNGGIFDGSANLTWDGSSLNTTNALVSGTMTLLTAPTNTTDAANKAYVDAATGSAPGGPGKAVQFNSDPAGRFTGSSDFLWDETTKELTVNRTLFALSRLKLYFIRVLVVILFLFIR